MNRLAVLILSITALTNCAGAQTASSLPSNYLSIGASGPSSKWSAGVSSAAHSLNRVGYKTLYRFAGGSDGQYPSGGLISVKGTLYGTTGQGGSGCGSGNGCGTIFAVSTAGEEHVLYSFKGGPYDGSNPSGDLLAVNGELFGVTLTGGAPPSCGTVFEVSVSGTELVLYSFKCGADGHEPSAAVIDVDEMLYGTTAYGGSGCKPSGCGTVFQMDMSGNESVLYRFKGGKDGAGPGASLINVNGAFYGVTGEGGVNNYGTIFKVAVSGEEQVLHSFGSGADGRYPSAALIDVNGTLFYGTAENGGSGSACTEGCGIVFKVSASGKEQVLYSFKGGTDGASPSARLIAINGVLYGTTEAGGAKDDGTVFKLSTSGKEHVLYSFEGGMDGAAPNSRLTAVNGKLYGATGEGGGGCGNYGCGTIFRILP